MESLEDRIERYIRKGRVLLEEARKDLEIGNYNKCVSAAYFAVEAFANALFLIKKQKTRGYRGRISLVKSFIGEKYAEMMEVLHDMRSDADHRDKLMTRSDAEHAIRIAEKLINALVKKLKEFVPDLLKEFFIDEIDDLKF